MKPRIGFIGLGLMGSAMVGRLQSLDYSVCGLANRSRNAVDAAVAKGGTEAPNARELAECSDIIMLCIDTSAHVEQRMLADDGVIAGLSEGKVVIDFGTSLPESTRRLGALVAEKSACMLDAPLGRTPTHAVEGKLNIMTSGDENAYQRVKPVLEDLGENVFHLGELGTGHSIKLINNFFAMTTANAMAEAFAAAEAAGVDSRKLYEVMSAGPLHSGMMDFIAAYALDGDSGKLAFSVRNARKDLTYYAQMTDGMHMASMMSPGTKQALGAADQCGFGDRNVPEILEFYRQLAKQD